MSIDNKLKELGVEIPDLAAPAGAYVPALIMNDLVFSSGQIPFVKGELPFKGTLGKNVSIEDGYQAARICCLNCLAAIKSVVGDLNRVEQIVKVTGFVSSMPDFFDQPKVMNGASELLVAIFGEAGKHTRSAVGTAALPLNVPVEVEMIVKLKS